MEQQILSHISSGILKLSKAVIRLPDGSQIDAVGDATVCTSLYWL